MIAPWRLLVVPALAGVLYFAVILAGMGGFDPLIWAFFTVLFLVWHVLIHVQRIPLAIVMAVHGIVAAAVLGIGSLVGGLVGWAPPVGVALALGVAATGAARVLRIPPEEVERIAREAAEAAALAEAAARDEAETQVHADGLAGTDHPPPDNPPVPEPPPDPENASQEAEADPPPPEGAESGPGAEADAANPAGPDDEPDADIAGPDPEPDTDSDPALLAVLEALDALPPDTPEHADLLAAIAPAAGVVPLDDLVSALFARGRARGLSRDLRAVTALVTIPDVAAQSLGAGDSDAAFHLVRLGGDAGAMAHWAQHTLAMLDAVPEARDDMPDDEALAETAEAMPELRDLLARIAARRPDRSGDADASDPETGGSGGPG